MSLFNLLLREAVADRRIGHNPAHGVRVVTGRAPERPVATTSQVNTIAGRVERRSDHILILTAAYTGMRWGELAGLARTNITRPGSLKTASLKLTKPNASDTASAASLASTATSSRP
jgi:integrase